LLTYRLNNGVRASATAMATATATATATAMATVTGMATAMATATVTDRRMLHVHSNLARFSNYLALFLASVCLLVSQKETNIWPSICATNKKNKYTTKKLFILYAYPCIGPKKSPILQKKYTKDGCKGKKPSHRLKTIFCVFVYLCIGAKKSQS
jgi:hypothetical protein